MHMADALISPVVGGAMLAVTAGLAAYSVKKAQTDLNPKKVPLMGVMGAFVFAAQMINFSIPGTGSSGHIGGGLLLAALLGPAGGFLTMTAILLIQALFFADGGLLAFGCNVFNLGFFTCFVTYPLIFRFIMRRGWSIRRIWLASLAAAVLGLQMGALSVVLETVLSGKTELPFGTFILMMQPIHLAIGLVEGLVTASVLSFIWKTRPEILEQTSAGQTMGNISLKRVLVVMSALVLLVGGLLSWFASANPDGLEWSMFKVAGTTELESDDNLHQTLAAIQEHTAFLPDYAFPANADSADSAATDDSQWPAVNAGTSVSGIVGGVMTLLLAGLTGLLISLFKRRRKNAAA